MDGEKKLFQLSDEDKINLQVAASKMVDKKYQFGAEVDLRLPPEQIVAVDCSELIEYLYYQIGLKIRDGSVYQYQASEPVEEKDIQIGDLVFKKKNDKTVHVGMVFSVNPNVVIEAEGWYGKVILRSLTKFQETRPNAAQYAGLRRFLEDKVVSVV